MAGFTLASPISAPVFADGLPGRKKGAVAKPQKKESNSLFLLFERKVGGIISHDRRKSWLILQVLRVICS
ncbi:MAG: hypothetical protein J6C40_10205, partial [Lentisphaeria bacterium]|nr:hypothetical protein [Lentisphaeria bacterium]